MFHQWKGFMQYCPFGTAGLQISALGCGAMGGWMAKKNNTPACVNCGACAPRCPPRIVVTETPAR